jgi:hypothetical protein
MNVKYEQFIGVYEEAFSQKYCNDVINFFEELIKVGCTSTRQADGDPKLAKEDIRFCLTNSTGMSFQHCGALVQQFNEVMWTQCYSNYVNNYGILKNFGPHNSYTYQVQKTEPGQGYHVWHCENSDRCYSNRILAWTLFLNDIEEGGETEFLFQHMRVKPKVGTLVIWPAGFTHTHRGNPPLSKTKYIATGWIEF